MRLKLILQHISQSQKERGPQKGPLLYHINIFLVVDVS